jgi:hypothetical protein
LIRDQHSYLHDNVSQELLYMWGGPRLTWVSLFSERCHRWNTKTLSVLDSGNTPLTSWCVTAPPLPRIRDSSRWHYIGCSERRLIGHSFYSRNFLPKSCTTCWEKCCCAAPCTEKSDKPATMNTVHLVIPSVEQCFAIKFVLKQEVKLAEILHRLSSRYGEATLWGTNVYDWWIEFPKAMKKPQTDHMPMFSRQLL